MGEVTPREQLSRISRYLRGYQATHMIRLGVELGLFQRIAEAPHGILPQELASALGLHTPYVESWCRSAYALELLEVSEDGRVRLAPFYDAILVNRTSPWYLAPSVKVATDVSADDYRRYAQAFRDGSTRSFQGRGRAFSRLIAETSAGLQRAFVKSVLPGIAEVQTRLEAGARVLDVGCGCGGLLVAMASAYPRCHAVGVDIDRAGIAAARKAVREAKLGRRVKIQGLEGPALPFASEFDLAMIFLVLHEIHAAIRPQVVAGVGKALRPGGYCVILDETYPSTWADLRNPDYARPVTTAFAELGWGNEVPTKEEQQRLLGKAGLTEVSRSLFGDGFTVLVARKG